MKRITELASRHASGHTPVIAGTGARTTAACIRLSKHAQDVGCDGVMILPVSYWPLTENEVREHYERVSPRQFAFRFASTTIRGQPAST